MNGVVTHPVHRSTPHGPASDELVEHVAAALHTLMRSWRYAAPIPATPDPWAERPARLEPWLQATNDPAWAADQPPAVDLAATPWHRLPADWRRRLLELGRAAADPVITEVTAGRTPDDLQSDPRYLEAVGRTLRRPWLAPPRVLVDGKLVLDVPPEDVLARTAVHVYAARLQGPGTLGEVPRYAGPPAPAAPPAPEDLAFEHEATDLQDVALLIAGQDLDPDEITAMIGVTPDWCQRRGDLHISPSDGRLSAPYSTGLWRLESEGGVDPGGSTVEAHVLWLLDQIEPCAGDLAAFIGRHRLKVMFWTFYSQVRPHTAWELAPETIKRMARIGASLALSHYVAPPDER